MMILYNFRHRGPYEYDKFAMNILQLHNEIVLLEKGLSEDTANQLAKIKADFDDVFGQLTGNEALSQEIVLLAYQFE